MRELEYIPDTTLAEIKAQRPVKATGLYIDYKGGRMTPKRLYFGTDCRRWYGDPDAVGGKAYYHFDNALWPVFTPDGEQFRIPELRNVCAEYDGAMISGFYRE